MYAITSQGYGWVDQRLSLVGLIRVWGGFKLRDLQTLFGAVMAYKFYQPPTRHQTPGPHYRQRGCARKGHRNAGGKPRHKLTIARGPNSIGEYDAQVSAWLAAGRVGARPKRYEQRAA